MSDFLPATASAFDDYLLEALGRFGPVTPRPSCPSLEGDDEVELLVDWEVDGALYLLTVSGTRSWLQFDMQLRRMHLVARAPFGYGG
jgi:hypothetical protein